MSSQSFPIEMCSIDKICTTGVVVRQPSRPFETWKQDIAAAVHAIGVVLCAPNARVSRDAQSVSMTMLSAFLGAIGGQKEVKSSIASYRTDLVRSG